MTENLKKRCLDAINRAMLYCLKVSNGSHCVTLLGEDKTIANEELYETINYLRAMIPNKDESKVLRGLVEKELAEARILINHPAADTYVKQHGEKKYSVLKPILEKLEVLCGQA